jgi:hypothetical protein
MARTCQKFATGNGNWSINNFRQIWGDPLSHRYEGETLRVIAIVLTFEGPLAEAFDQIRGSAAGNVAVMERILSTVTAIGCLTINSRLREAMR